MEEGKEKKPHPLVERLGSWFGKSRKNRILAGVVLALLLVCLCGLFYWLGTKHGGQEPGQRTAVSEPVKQKKPEKKGQETTGDSVVTQDAVSAQAVTPEAVQEETVAPESTTNGQKTSQNTAKNTGSGEKSGETAASQGSAGTAGAYGGRLMVSGNQLCTADGTPIQLRGVSTHGLSWFPEYVNEQMFAELRSWGANTVRLAMYTAEYNGYCTGGEANRQKLKNLVKQGVQYATNQNLYVIIDWHILSDGNPNTYKTQAIDFFTEMSQLYKDNDHVIYEICNEPNGGVSWSEVKSYATEVIAAIRANDANGIILVGSPTWSQEVDKAAADPISGYSNIMYTLHFYADTHRDSLRSTLKKAVSAGLPVFVSEFGICDASGNGAVNTAQADLWIQTLNQYGISYVAWSLCNKAESASLIQSGCSKVNGITENDLSESGRWLLKTLQGTTCAGDARAAQQESQQTGNTGAEPSTAQQETVIDNQNQSQPVTQTRTPEQYAPQAAAGTEYTVVNSWQEGDALCIQYEIKVTNTGGDVMEGWSGSLVFPAGVSVVSGWNANFSASGNTVSFSSMDYNKTIQPNARAEGIGCIVRIQ